MDELKLLLEKVFYPPQAENCNRSLREQIKSRQGLATW